MNIEISTTLELSNEERATRISWFENDLEKSANYGNSEISFPEEEILVAKIKESSNNVLLSEFDINLILGWMDKSLFPKVGNRIHFLPHEETLYNKIHNAAKDILDQKKEQEKKLNSASNQKKKSFAIRFADKLFREKILKKKRENELKQLDQKIQDVAAKLAPFFEERNAKKNRSIDEKIAASQKLKSDLEEIRKKLKF